MGDKQEFPDPQAPPRGRGLLMLGAIGLLAGLTALFSAAGPDRGSTAYRVDEAGNAQVVVARDRSGHYVAEGAINGIPVTFLVDTGATDVAISEALARELGLELGPQITVMTAAGPVPARMTRFDEVSVGPLRISNVRGTVTRSAMDEVLLGMSFLRHFRLTQQGNELLIETGS